MRRASAIAALGGALTGIAILVGAVLAMAPGTATAGCHARIAALCGPPCSATPGYTLVEGCCDQPPCLCDHVWDNYCQQKARRYARWHHDAPCGPAGGEGPWPASCPACAQGAYPGN